MSGIVSVNTGLAVDFRAQVCSSSLGTGFTGGVGSILDFTRGAKRTKNGKAFVVMRSTIQNEDGTRTSAILPALPGGSLVSIPRCDIMSVVTEYGVADLRDLSIKDRVKALITLAHPDFREGLTAAAAKYGYC
jgi:4-hydroxybutyrate CoA-transferase